mgnify:CR=1 FL=1
MSPRMPSGVTMRMFVREVSGSQMVSSGPAAAPKTATSNPLPEPPFKLDRPEIEVAAFKRAESGNGWAVRLVNVTERPVSATLTLATHTAAECDLMERPIGTGTAKGEVALQFAAFEVKTVCLT